jgi:hypothetical protein
MHINIPRFHTLIARTWDGGPMGGVGIFVRKMYHVMRENIFFMPHVLGSTFVEVTAIPLTHTIVGVICRPN